MKVTLYSHTGDQPEATGFAWLHEGKVLFSDSHTAELCKQLAMDHAGPVSTDEPERFLRALPLSLSGSMLRAEMEPGF